MLRGATLRTASWGRIPDGLAPPVPPPPRTVIVGDWPNGGLAATMSCHRGENGQRSVCWYTEAAVGAPRRRRGLWRTRSHVAAPVRVVAAGLARLRRPSRAA